MVFFSRDFRIFFTQNLLKEPQFSEIFFVRLGWVSVESNPTGGWTLTLWTPPTRGGGPANAFFSTQYFFQMTFFITPRVPEKAPCHVLQVLAKVSNIQTNQVQKNFVRHKNKAKSKRVTSNFRGENSGTGNPSRARSAQIENNLGPPHHETVWQQSDRW